MADYEGLSRFCYTCNKVEKSANHLTNLLDTRELKAIILENQPIVSAIMRRKERIKAMQYGLQTMDSPLG